MDQKNDIMIGPGTTPDQSFTLPIDTSLVKKARVVYAQRDVVIVVREGDDLQMEGNEISFRLTQEETLRFKSDSQVDIQLRVLTHDGKVPWIKPVTVSVERCFDREVLE